LQPELLLSDLDYSLLLMGVQTRGEKKKKKKGKKEKTRGKRTTKGVIEKPLLP